MTQLDVETAFGAAILFCRHRHGNPADLSLPEIASSTARYRCRNGSGRAQDRSIAVQFFLDVDDALAGRKTDAATLDAASLADREASRWLELRRRQFKSGNVGTIALFSASAAPRKFLRFSSRPEPRGSGKRSHSFRLAGQPSTLARGLGYERSYWRCVT